MSRRHHWRVNAALAVALLLSSTVESWAQSVPPDDEAEQARLEKARTVTPQQRSTVDRLIYKLDDDLLLERVLDAPRGIYARLGGIGEGAGFAVGPAFRYNATRFDFKTSAAASMKTYFIGEASMRFPGTIGHNEYFRPRGPYLELYGRRRDFPQEDFFGLGPDSQESQRSNYAQRDSFGEITAGFEKGLLNAGVGVGYLDVSIGAGTDTRMPSSTAVFSPEEMPGVSDRSQFVVIQPFLEFATVDRAVNDRSGGIYRFSVAQYRDQDLDRYSFVRWEADVRHYFSFVKDTRTIALRAVAASARPGADQEVPFYMQPTLGGARSLRGYRTFRYRDRSAALLQAEYRWRINEFVTGALFYDTGAVGASLDELGRVERNYGIGLRAGNRMGSAFRIDFAFGGREGNRLLIRFDDVF
jgi:outer membrane protein assembly factor BamA